jgi:hypothetical protein
MLSLKRWRKSRRPPTDPQPSSSKTSTEITPAEAVSQELSEDVASGAGPETELGQLTLQARLDVTQEQIAVTDLRPHGHNFNGNVVTENARAHFGNVYNFNQQPFSVLDDTARPDLMEALSFSGMSHRLMSITPAYAETCKWILDRPEYLKWRDLSQRSSHHGVFWIKGKAGTGKSTLMSCLHEHNCQQDRDGITVSFFFNARSPDELVKSTEGMYRCLLHQLLMRLPRLKASLSHLGVPKGGAPWPIEWLESAFRIVILGISKDEEITCFVDALDECKMEDVRRAIDRFEDLAETVTTKSIRFRICFSSRYYPNITMRHHEELQLDVQPEHMDDISQYIDAKLTVRQGIKLELSPKIFDRCSGIFLWVVLVVKRLREASDTGRNRSQLLAILDATPEELEELFADVVAEPDESLILIVQWSLFSTRKLTTKELYLAVQGSVGGTGTGYWDIDEIDDDGIARYLLHASRGLMELTSTPGPPRYHMPGSTTRTYSSNVAQWPQILIFIHESVREYFLCGGLAILSRPSLHEINAVGHAKLAEGCLSYLESAVSHSAFPVSCKPEDWKVTIESCKEQLPLIWYASENFLHHSELAFAGGVVGLAILERCPLQYTTTAYYHSDRLCHGSPPSLLYLLLYRGCFELARALLTRPSKPSYCPAAQSDPTSTPCTPTRLVTPDLRFAYDELSLAIGRDRTDLVQLFFDNGFDVNMETGPWGRPICFAVSRDDYRIVQVLSSYGARVDTVETRKILHIAAEHASQQMVQFLLEKGAPVNSTDDGSQTALHLTVSRQAPDDFEVADILLEAGADIEAADCDGRTVLIKAAASRRTRLVQFLLGRGANVHARDHQDLTAFSVATDMRISHQVHQARGPMGSDPAMYRILHALLNAGADINARCGSKNTMLDIACLSKDYGLLIFLVERGAFSIPEDGPGPREEIVLSVLEEAHQHAYDNQPGSPTSETWSIDDQYSHRSTGSTDSSDED